MSSDENHGLGEFDSIVAEYVERLNAGERIEPEEVLLRHPRRGEEILEQLELFVGFASSERFNIYTGPQRVEQLPC